MPGAVTNVNCASNRVHSGDRIIAINGHSLEGMPHHVAVELIREAPAVVQLVISQANNSPTRHPLVDHTLHGDGGPDGVTIEGQLGGHGGTRSFSSAGQEEPKRGYTGTRLVDGQEVGGRLSAAEMAR